MTVGKLIQLLSEFPDDAEITDICGNPINDIGFDQDEDDQETYNVWIDTNYIYNIENDLK